MTPLKIQRLLRSSLRTRLALTVTALVVLTVVVIVLVSLHFARVSMKASIAEQQFGRLSSIADAVDQKFISRRVLLKTLGDSLEAQRPDDGEALQAFVRQHGSIKQFFDNFSVIGIDGTLLANYNNPQSIGKLNVADRPYFKQTLALGHGVISQPIVNRLSGLPQVLMTEPVFDASGRVVRIITAQINLTENNVLGELASIKFGQSGYVFITNTDGIVISSPRKSRIMKHTDAEGGSDAAVARALAGFEGTTEGLDQSGVYGLYAFKQLKQTNWVIGAVYPRNEAFAPIQRIEQAALAGVLGVSLLVGGLSLVLTRRQLEPLTRLHQHMLTSADSPHYVPMPGQRAADEIGDLQTTFESIMAQRRSSEQRLKSNGEYLASILAQAGDAFVSIDGDGLLTEWNHQAELTFGWSRAEAIGKPMAELIIPHAMRAAHQHGFAAFRHTGKGAVIDKRIELEALHRDGHVFPIELSVAAVKGEAGYVANAFIRDISERRAAVERIAASEKFVRDIADNLPALVSYVDRDQRYTFVNAKIQQAHPAGEKLIGRTMRETRGDKVFDAISPWVRRALAGETVTFEYRGSADLGTQDRVYEVNYIPDRDVDGQTNGFYSLSFDITARKRAEDALAASEARFRKVTDNMPALVSYLDREERFEFANAAFNDWFGLDPAAMIGRRLVEVVGTEVYAPRAEMLAQALGGQRVEFDTHRLVDGAPRDVHTIYVPDVARDGTVKGVFALSLNITALKSVERELARQARVDPLTGLHNRLAFNDGLPVALARAQRSGDALALMYLDIDRFKTINDTLGHASGDQVLVEFARRLQDCVRSTDTVARLGGDEFVILLEGVGEPDAAAGVARKILSGIAGAGFAVKDQLLDVTSSVGVAYYAPTLTPIAGAHLLACADRALYRAKAAGRNTFDLQLSGEDLRLSDLIEA